jgi:hypothetical protein
MSNLSTKTFTMMIIIMMSAIIITNSVLLYSVHLSLSNQNKLLMGQSKAVEERNELLDNINATLNQVINFSVHR